MRVSFRSVIGGAAALGIAAGMLFAGAGSAFAAGQPSYEPDANALGTLSFFDASGNQITSGSTTASPMAAFYMASGPGVAGNNKAYVSFYTPVQGQTPAAWQTGNVITSAQTYPNATYPGALGTTSNAVVQDAAANGSLQTNQIATFPSSSTTDPNVYQVRIFTDTTGTHYYSADVLVSGTTWTQVYPVVKVNTSFSTIAASPASPAAHASSVTLTSTLSASDSSHPAGSAHLFDGTTDLGAATSFTASTGAVSSTLTPADGNHSYTFVFTPTDTTTYNGATSAALPYTVNAAAPAASTTTTLALDHSSGPAFQSVTMTATVTATPATPTAVGTVNFFDNGSTTAFASAPVNASGVATATVTSLGQGGHSIVASFVPTNSANFKPSSSAPVTAQYDAPACTTCRDDQTITTVVAPGTLSITTPYTPNKPFSLGTMALDPNGLMLSASKVFPAVGDAPITITDTRAGDLPWTASASTTDFADPASDLINGQNLSFTGVTKSYITGNALSPTKPVITNDVVGPTTPFAANATGSSGLKGPVAHTFATAAHGVGSVNISGSLNLLAPTSTVAGTYTATLTFTVG